MSTLLQKGNELLKLSRFDDAYAAFSHALRASNSTSYAAAYGAGRAAGGMRDFEKAMGSFAIAAKIAPDKASPLIELAGLAYRSFQFEEALLYLDRAAKIEAPSNAAVLTAIRCHFELGNYDSIIAMCDSILADEEIAYRARYEWSVRKTRALFHSGRLQEALEVVAKLRLLDQAEADRRCPLRAEDVEPIDVVLNCYRRENEVRFQRWWLEQQSIPVGRFWVWHNDGGMGRMQRAIANSNNAINDENHKFYGRFTYGLLASARHLAYFDDDTIPGLFWFQNCLHGMREDPGVYVAVGVKLLEQGRYSPHERNGWASGDQQKSELADLGGHAWFFERDWLRFFWFERPTTFHTGEDMHLSFSVQKHCGLPTIAPAHPQQCMGLWGSVLGQELGQDIGSSSFAKAGSHFEQRDSCVADLNARGWTLLRQSGQEERG